MRLIFLFASLLLSCVLMAQQRAGTVIDAVHLRDGKIIEGTILEYNYGRDVVVVMDNGNIRRVEWEDIKRVNFRIDKRRNAAPVPQEEVELDSPEEEEPLPERSYWHMVSTNLAFGATSGRFGSNATTIGGGVSYHLIRPFGNFLVGVGVDANLMSYRRAENVVAATGLIDFPINYKAKNVRIFLRFEAGPSLPFGTTDESEDITQRMVTFLYHPALGLEFLPRKKPWGSMTVDLGYRFLNSRFTITTNTLDVVERNVQYRRLVLRGGIKF
ncbi:MAG: hypothetical protein AAGA31_00120 [Bacteroidota bacterium]